MRMIRSGLTAYLVLAMLAGPALCCCTTPRFCASRSEVKGTQRHQADAPAHPCCSHRNQHAGKSPGENSNQPNAPNCPCHRQRADLATLSALTSELERQVEAPLLPSGPMESAAIISMVAPISSLIKIGPTHGSIAFPFLTAQEILRTLCAFLC